VNDVEVAERRRIEGSGKDGDSGIGHRALCHSTTPGVVSPPSPETTPGVVL
jgi:hypothetical protein